MIGKEVFDIRRSRGLEKKQLAFIIGVSPRTVSNWENAPFKEIKEEFEFYISEIKNQLPEIKNIVKNRIEDLRRNGHAV